MERQIFNHPIRKGITDSFYPEKMSIDEFKSVIVDNFDAFASNMIKLQGAAIEEKYVEEWAEQYLAWLEIEEER